MRKLKIHWFELHYNGVSAGDHFTDVSGLVTCSYCKRLLAKRRRTKDAPDGAKRRLTGRNGKPTNVLADGTLDPAPPVI